MMMMMMMMMMMVMMTIMMMMASDAFKESMGNYFLMKLKGCDLRKKKKNTIQYLVHYQ